MPRGRDQADYLRSRSCSQTLGCQRGTLRGPCRTRNHDVEPQLFLNLFRCRLTSKHLIDIGRAISTQPQAPTNDILEWESGMKRHSSKRPTLSAAAATFTCSPTSESANAHPHDH